MKIIFPLKPRAYLFYISFIYLIWCCYRFTYFNLENFIFPIGFLCGGLFGEFKHVWNGNYNKAIFFNLTTKRK